MAFRIHLAKENFKFSGTHFTLLGNGKAERLHGHNYYVQVDVDVAALDPDLGFAFDFNALKPAIREACQELDEYVLLPRDSKFLTIQHIKENVSVTFADKNYSFPIEDVRELPLANVTSEELARYLASQISKRLPHLKRNRLTVRVEETRGQGASYTLET